MQNLSNEETDHILIMKLFIRVHAEFVLTGRQIYQIKTVSFQNAKITQQSKIKEKTSIYPQPLMRVPSMREVF